MEFTNTFCPCALFIYRSSSRLVIYPNSIRTLGIPVSRNTKKRTTKARRNKRVLGPSIEDRSKAIETREHFGHWEIDTVIGSQAVCDPVLLTLVERKTRYEVILKLKNKSAQAVDEAMDSLRQRAGDAFNQLFKTITSDNGSEFAGLSTALQETLDVYFTHPYASWERGTSENQHKIIRRFSLKDNHSKHYVR